MKIIVLFLILISFYAVGQDNGVQSRDSQLYQITENSKILILDSTVNNIYIPPPRNFNRTLNLRSSEIIVEYVGSWTEESKLAFNYASSIWESLLTSNVPIHIEVKFENLATGVIGQSTIRGIRDFDSSDPEFMEDTYYPFPLAEKLSGFSMNEKVEIEETDLKISFNNNIPFYFGIDGECPSNKIDFVTTALHEMAHGFGFDDSGEVYGLEGLYAKNFAPNIYDRFLIDEWGNHLTQEPVCSLTVRIKYFLTHFLYWDSDSQANGTQLYTPKPWAEGSSVCHLHPKYHGTSNALMTHFQSYGEAIHGPGNISLAILDDLGWDIDSNTDPINIVLNDLQPTCGHKYGSITVDIIGGNPPYFITWSNGETTQTIENLLPGTYSVTVSDFLGNYSESSVEIFPAIIASQDAPLWSTIIAKYNLPYYELNDRNIHIEEELIIDVNYNFKNVIFSFADDAKLRILDDVTVFINDYQGNKSILKACDHEWNGIVLESGANLVSSNTEVYDAKNGIIANNNSYLTLNAFLMKGYSGNVGIDLIGEVKCETQGLTIENYNTGIHGVNNTSVPHFYFTTINNSAIGFDFKSSTVVIVLSSTESRITSINLEDCPGSLLGINIFSVGENGINAINSPYLSIFNPVCGSYLKTGINLDRCSYSSIADEFNSTSGYNIKATDYGIIAKNCFNLEISDNEIQIEGNGVSSGIQLTDCNFSRADDNKFLLGSNKMGIETVNGSNNEISKNTFEYSSGSVFPLARAAVIRTQGSFFEHIHNNTINGPGLLSGIHAINSSGNTYSCNDLSGILDGLGVYYNSAFHDIKGNKFLDCAYDLKTRSVLGPQYFKGNEFYNGNCLAEGLDEHQIEDSRFLVNQNIPHHMPSNPNPGNGKWFKHQDVTEYFDDCPEDPRGGRTGFDDERVLSDYFDDLKLERSVSPERFFVNMMHLLEYDYARDDYSLPRYITEDPVWLELDEWTELAEAINSLSDISELSGHSTLNQNDLDSLSILQKSYVEADDEATRELIYTQLSALMARLSPAFDQERTIDSLEMDQLKNQFRSLSGRNDQMVMRWADIYSMYIDFLQKGEVAESNKAALLTYSRECADKYGDAIHLARSMTNIFDNTYFDVYDDCPEDIEPRTASNTLNVKVQPNPTNGAMTVIMTNPFTGSIELFDITGKLVFSDRCENNFEKTIHLNLNEGVFMMKITSIDGESDTEKVIITK